MHLLLLLVLSLLLLLSLLPHAFSGTFIIHMDESDSEMHADGFADHLKSVSESAKILYVYKEVIHGYSAQLTPDEARQLEHEPGVLSVQDDPVYQLHTTRSPEFLGLAADAPAEEDPSAPAADVIIGVLDSGVRPGIRSFDDWGLGPVPSTWKGGCDLPACNRKLVGARFFSQGYEAWLPINETLESRSPIDDIGHGTHTSTTAAGSPVPGANLLGSARGTARGMAPHARLAMYKVCWRAGCVGSDILAGMEQAIQDGVDILSVSIGGLATDYYVDPLAIGAFEAAARGIFVACSAGNSGPAPGVLSNVAPWITTVGAGTMDRKFPTTVMLGNGKTFPGTTLYSEQAPIGFIPLVYGGNVNRTATGSLCTKASLIPEEVEGRIVVCDHGMGSGALKGLVVKNAGGVGMILTNTDTSGEEELIPLAHFLPAAAVGLITAAETKRYIANDPNPTAAIAPGTTLLGVQPTPLVAKFSSRGPNPITPGVLKPDLIAPGVEILAGWTGRVGPTSYPQDTRQVEFNLISGTSMACPHVSGLAALVKAAHPEWSPAAIRSALMTTAYVNYQGESIQDAAVTGRPATPLDYGSGHVNPVPSLDPGLVYDATVDDYVGFLCALKYSPVMIQLLTKQAGYTCEVGKEYRLTDLNYPSFSVSLLAGGGVVQHTRTVTNVGSATAVYRVSVSQGIGIDAVQILVLPDVLEFSHPNEGKAYAVVFTANPMPSGTTAFARLEWSDGDHTVASPVLLSWT